MAQFRTSRTFDLIFLVAVAAFIWWAAIHRVGIGDWIYFRGYQPTSETTQIAQDAGLSPLGQKLLFRTNPQFASKQAVTAECDVERLGCINSKGQVFILDDPGQHDQTVVTAAHEMLHLAYRRLPQARKDALAPLLDQATAMNAGVGLSDELRGTTNPEDRRDEAHSLLGTEYKDLPPSLEQYYAQYFTDRPKVVAAESASER